MASPEADSRLSVLLVPALEKVAKNASWRNGHSKLAQQCKALIERLSHPPTPPLPAFPNSSSSLPGPLSDGGATVYSLADSETFLTPLISACSSGAPRVAEPALNCIHKLVAYSYLHGEADPSAGPHARLLAQLIEAVCGCYALGATEEAIELLVLKTLLSAVTSTDLRIHGDSLLQIVRTCYDLYLGSRNPVNQSTAKASLIQMLVIVFRRMEGDSTVPIQPIVVAEMMEPGGRSRTTTSVDANFVQGFITRIINDIDGVLNPSAPLSRNISANKHDGAFSSTVVESTNPTDLLDSTDKDMLDAKYWEINMYKTALEGMKDELGSEGMPGKEEDTEVQIRNKLKRDAFLVFRSLCKISMKIPPKESVGDPTLMKGKIMALELLKILLENAGAMFRTSERFLGAIKQYLCLSLLKNSASADLIVFQLSCSIFISLVSRFRAGLKAEIGVFFPMIILRVLENVCQPNFQRKTIVLCFMEKLCVDPQVFVDIFINYDFDVHSSNIFERIVKGLLKTAQGPPPGTPTTLVPPQNVIMKFEAMKCLVAILRSMGDWMNKQLRIPDLYSQKTETVNPSPQKLDAADPRSKKTETAEHNGGGVELPLTIGNSDESAELSNSHSASEVASIEQHRAFKLELQEGISLFNHKPKMGIEFLINIKKVGNSPEEIAVFLKSAPGLNKTLIGDYLGERESLKVMHAYVDSFEFQGMEFDEAIRCFLEGFSLPGEAQKIDCIMEKFAERYHKCNPLAFTSADTAYALAYSVIMLNTDSHDPMVKNKMSSDDFIRNNRGINGGTDLPQEYLRSLFKSISENEIRMKDDDDLAPQQVQSFNSNRILGLDSILNFVIRKRDSSTDSSDDMIKQMQEQLKEKAPKTESIYHSTTDVVILRFMIEVCWAPMLAAFSVPLDQSDDQNVITLCLEGFRSAVHVTAVMAMKTQRDAFVTSLAKFTSLHSAADIKQKNVDAIKAILYIADEDGNYLQEAWEHILTCVSRLERLQLFGKGVLPDAAFFSKHPTEIDNAKQANSSTLPVLKNKGSLSAAMTRGTYDSAGVGGHASGVITSEQMNNLFSNLNLLEQVRIAEVNHIFIQSEMLDSEAIIDFVKVLCTVSMEELHSTSDPRVYSLTKIVEIAHYNMNRIRLVWSSIWNVLSEFFVTIGCSENVSVSIFAMDSLCQIAMKFLERKELANYNFQNEFMKPFVIVMRKSRAVEIRELIIRCVSQTVLVCVGNVKSGWKSMFMVLATASYDDHKNIVLLAFEIIEKILRDYFPYVTETETTAFADCVNCLIAFTNSRFNKDISLNAITLLQFCASKLAEGNFVASAKSIGNGGSVSCPPSPHVINNEKQNAPLTIDKDDRLHLWFPLLAGLLELAFDLRADIRQSALQMLFDTLKNYGHLFSLRLWEKVFDSVLFPIFDSVRHAIDPSSETFRGQGIENDTLELDQDAWLYETCKLALQLVVDLFVKFYDTVNPLLEKVLTLLTNYIKLPHQRLAGIGITAFVHLMNNAGSLFFETNWEIVVAALKETSTATLPDFSYISSGGYLDNAALENGKSPLRQGNGETRGSTDEDFEGLRARKMYFAVGDAKCHAVVQLLLIQSVMEIYNMYRAQISAKNTLGLFEALHTVACHAHKVNSDTDLRSKLQELGSKTQMHNPPVLRLENESYQLCLILLQNIATDRSLHRDLVVEPYLVDLCREVLEVYLRTANAKRYEASAGSKSGIDQVIPGGSAKRRELAARAPVVVSTLQAICGLEDTSLEKNLAQFFPLLAGLIRCEHGSSEVQLALSSMLSSSVGRILLRGC
ncbi:brefeldin A-inhibited guanine nucleotide-exchange protein 2-like isoform X1 [Zingiber officinale]|uniref:SEC7 domain-containing protein n=1 Tax=Zingiber officinale TaxID=94328 RepID=A0A8J5LHR2_ZINOF|nr:brefeldin A-inhibited guanine nucleotide-exchange protein 2-like isoform X1 [Zingiber officinale]KAG6519455.1 hypothetical protein ZIOFF_022949 [Zingiber officinale]